MAQEHASKLVMISTEIAASKIADTEPDSWPRSSINRAFVFDEFLVDPMPPVMTSPNPSVHEPAGNRSSWNDDHPQMPDFCPHGSRLQGLVNVFLTVNHRDLKETKPPSGK
jgi:hypothetical protein